MTDDHAMNETLADIRELPATAYIISQPGPQNVAVQITLPDGTTVSGTSVLTIGE